MPAKRSIFFDEWRACLHAHYEHVVREGDAVTEPTLRHVLQQTGLTDAELDAIRAQVGGEPVQDEAAADDFVRDEPVMDDFFAHDLGHDELVSDELAGEPGDLSLDDLLPGDDPDQPPRPSQLSLF